MLERINNATQFIRDKTDFEPSIGIVLGSGLGPLADQVEQVFSCSTTDIPDYPRSTVEGHDGEFILGTLTGQNVVLLKGRVHAYEGYSLAEATLPIRMMP